MVRDRALGFALVTLIIWIGLAVGVAGSLVAAVEDDTNWPSNLVQYASVTRIGVVPQTVAVADETFLSVEFDIEVVF